MVYRRITENDLEALWRLQKAYKAEIGEDEPGEEEFARLSRAVAGGAIRFYGCEAEERLVGCCSLSLVFSTYDYRMSGVFEDFYIVPEYRHKGIARELVRFARQESGVSTMTVGCADCDAEMYRALGFTVPLGNLLAWDGDEN